MHTNDRETSARLLNVLSTLYCQPFAVDFRKPVEILYPNIASDYLSIIKHPMDLGTLLLECMKDAATLKSIRDGLKQIFINSMRFNVDTPMIEATSRHLEAFAMGLFEENMKVLFNDKVSVAEDLRIILAKKRTSRLLIVSKTPLRISDIRFVEQCILTVQENVPRELLIAINNIKNVLQNYLLSFENQSVDSPTPPVLTIEKIFFQLMEASRSLNPVMTSNDNRGGNRTPQPSLAILLNSQISSSPSPLIPTSTENVTASTHQDIETSLLNVPFNAVSERLRIKSLNKNVLMPCTLLYLNALDDLLGLLFVKLEERLLRGTSHSSVWQRPYGIVWAPQNKSPWWPAMVLAISSNQTYPTLPMELGSSNISRIPPSICKQLLKLKIRLESNEVKYPNTTLNLLTVPDGYMLVEFFGSHDFGWLKEGSVHAMTSDGRLPVDHGKIGCSASGVRHAIATEKWLDGQHTKHLSNRDKQRHKLEKKVIDKIRIDALMSPSNWDGTDREIEGIRQEDNDNYDMSGRDGSSSSSSTFYDPMENIPYEVEEDDDVDDDDSDELSHVPSITELAAEVAVLSNPYKEKFNFNPGNELLLDQGKVIKDLKEVEVEVEDSESPKKKGKRNISDSITSGLSSSSTAASTSTSTSKLALKRAPPKLKVTLDSEQNEKAGLRAENGDYTGLLVNGLFTASVLRTGSYYKSKDINIIKTMYFTRWIEMVHPVPGGPTFPEQKKRGHKKNSDIIVGDTNSKDMSMDIDGMEMLEYDSSKDKIKDKDKDKNGVSHGSASKDKDKDKDKEGQKGVKSLNDDKYKDKDKDKEIGEDKKRCMSSDKSHPLKRRRRKASDSLATLPLKRTDKKTTRPPSHRPGHLDFESRDKEVLDLNGSELQVAEHTDGMSPYPSTAVSENAQGPYSVLSGGCTLHIAGEGAIQTRYVDLNARLFQRESRCKEERKVVLREELRVLTECLRSLGELANNRIDTCKIKRKGLPIRVKKKPRIPTINPIINLDVSGVVNSDPTEVTGSNEIVGGIETSIPRRKSPLNANPSSLFMAATSQTKSANFPPRFQRAQVVPPSVIVATSSEGVISSSTSSTSAVFDDTDVSSNIEKDIILKGDGDPADEGSEQDCMNVHGSNEEISLIIDALEGQETDDEDDCETNAVRASDDEQEGSAQETDDEVPERQIVRETVDLYEADDAEETEDEVDYKMPLVCDEGVDSDTNDDDSRNMGQYSVENRHTEVHRNSYSGASMTTGVEGEEEHTDDAIELELDGDAVAGVNIDDEIVSDDNEVKPRHTQTSREGKVEVMHIKGGLEDEEDYAGDCAVIDEESLDVAFKSRNYNDQIYRVGGLDAVNVEEEEEEEEGDGDGDVSEDGRDISDEESHVGRGFSSEEDDDDSVQTVDSHRY